MKGTTEKKPIVPMPDLGSRDVRAYAAIFFCGVVSSVFIQRDFGVQEFLGGVLLASILLAMLYRDIKRYKPHYLDNRLMLALLAFMVVFTLGLGRLSWHVLVTLTRGLELDAGGAAAFGLPVPTGAMLVTLLFDFHTAIVFAFVVSLLSGLWLHEPVFAIFFFVGGLTAAFSVIRCKRRTAILMGGAYLLAANLVTLLPIQLFRGQIFTQETLLAAVFASAASLGVVAMVSLLLPVLEYVFKITTDISLLELLDLEQPLMKNLMVSAPGTYHHSIIVGNLVEAVAESVGVNPMLGRIGAYYHDIGKIKMPEYFIENSPWGVSKHDKLTPHMSSMILISHVKEGVELARQYKLPETVISIIEQHHGTALITYFFEKARVQPNGKELSENDYRYPGPRPQTRITALIMMADAVEAASRVLNDPTPARISALVDRIINHIFLAGQLDECALTFRDINIIKERFTYILTGILHKRIDYPGFDFGKEKDDHDKQPAADDKARQRAHREGLPDDALPVGARRGGA